MDYFPSCGMKTGWPHWQQNTFAVVVSDWDQQVASKGWARSQLVLGQEWGLIHGSLGRWNSCLQKHLNKFVLYKRVFKEQHCRSHLQGVPQALGVSHTPSEEAGCRGTEEPPTSCRQSCPMAGLERVWDVLAHVCTAALLQISAAVSKCFCNSLTDSGRYTLWLCFLKTLWVEKVSFNEHCGVIWPRERTSNKAFICFTSRKLTMHVCV